MKLINERIPGSKYFWWSEAACFDKARTVAKVENIIRQAQMMDEFREWWGRAIVPNSWYRTPEHNAAEGGASASQHMEGKATDFPVENLTPELIEAIKRRWEMICYKYKVTGAMFVYDWGVHLDSRTDTKFKFYDYR